jgi:Tol biopolymer transport system component
MLAYIALDTNEVPRVWVRSLETDQARIAAPADVTRQPIFWSPDSRYLGFYSDGKVKKVDVGGGPPETIVEATNFAGGSWSRDDVIVFSNTNGIMQVPASGGQAVPVAALDKTRKENAQLLPSFLPDGRHFLYLRLFGGVESQTGIYVGSIDSTPEAQSSTRLLAAGQNVTYAPSPTAEPGHLLFLRDGLLMAQPFDEGSRSLVGDAVRVGGDRIETNSVLASFSASPSGTLIYRKGSGSTGVLSVVDRSGKAAPLFANAELDRPAYPRLSPDGRRLAIVLAGALWLYDLGGRPPIKLTFGEEQAYSPIWARDGQRIIYERGGDSATTLFGVAADGSGAAPEPVAPEGHFHPHGWSADGEIVAARVAANAGDLVRFAPQAGAKIHDILATPQSEGFAASISPDGRWLAYTADPTGRTEIWVRPVSGAGAAVRVSPNGGNEPVWSRDGRELFYVEDRKMMAVPVTTGTEFNFKTPLELFTTNIIRGQQPPSYDVTPDGRFVMITLPDMGDAPITVILNWTELLRDRAATH